MGGLTSIGVLHVDRFVVPGFPTNTWRVAVSLVRQASSSSPCWTCGSHYAPAALTAEIACKVRSLHQAACPSRLWLAGNVVVMFDGNLFLKKGVETIVERSCTWAVHADRAANATRKSSKKCCSTGSFIKVLSLYRECAAARHMRNVRKLTSDFRCHLTPPRS